MTAVQAPIRQDSAAATSTQAGRAVTTETEVSAMPPATNARPVRTQASAVRSLAIEKRGSGSVPTP